MTNHCRHTLECRECYDKTLPLDGWNGEREEIVVPTKSGMNYHFSIPIPLYDYITRLKELTQVKE